MANSHSFKKIPLSVAHLPTSMIIIGYVVFWIELYFLGAKHGQTSMLATLCFLIIVLMTFMTRMNVVTEFVGDLKLQFSQLNPFNKCFVLFSGVVILLTIGCAGRAAMLPPHLGQEFDVLNYHLTIPRQHLILGSLQWIPWSTGDLLLIVLDYALAPYWFVTVLPNKIPQFIIFIGILAVSFQLVRYFRPKDYWAPFIVVLAIMGTHAIGIQMGTAMMDLVMCYLFLAALHSLLKGNIILAVFEFTFFFWSKTFIPLQMTCLLLIVCGIIFILTKVGWKKISWVYSDQIQGIQGGVSQKGLKKIVLWFVILSLFLGLPFLTKSLHYAGTPLYPFKLGAVKINSNIDYESNAWKSLEIATDSHMQARNSYGYGRSISDFIKHFWLISVPDQGVNNKFDYPLGLTYLLFLGPFLYLVARGLRKKELSILATFTIIYWLSWWWGSQQARFLYIPVILILVTVLSSTQLRSKIFMGALMIALLANGLSIIRAHKGDLFVSDAKLVMREKDRKILEFNKQYIKQGRSDHVEAAFYDNPYAQFPFYVTKASYPFVLEYTYEQ